MDLQPKLVAAADMCEAGEDVNLDELAFLLRYAIDELSVTSVAVSERDELMEQMRNRLLARCDLLNREQRDFTRAREGSLEELEALNGELERELRQRYPEKNVHLPDLTDRESLVNTDQYKSGR